MKTLTGTMRAIVIDGFGGPEKLVERTLPLPEPGREDVRIKVKAFGINRAETYMRRGAWPEISEVSGIECVGEVDDDPSNSLPEGQKVAAVMGGLGRTRNGSYAEYTCISKNNLFVLDSDLNWADLAAIPESYATAWICLFINLSLRRGQTVLVRGGTSALGQAAINLARQAGLTVLASTRSEQRRELLKTLGVDQAIIDTGSLSSQLRRQYPEGIDAVLELVGNSTVRDSLQLVRRGGAVCLAGFLGGGDPIQDFNPIMDMPSGVNLSFYGSFMLGTPDNPLSEIPMQQIVDSAAEGAYRAKPSRIFQFEEIQEAHRFMESNEANGKPVVVL